MKKLLVLVALLVFASPAAAQDRLLIAGTGDCQQLLRQLARGFEAANPGTRIVVPPSIGSTGGIKSLIRGKCDMARVARPLKESEKAQADDLGYREFAASPVFFTANLPESCIENLTGEQVVGIYSGAINNWSELGGCPDRKIYVTMREEGDSARLVLEKGIPGFRTISRYAGKTIYSTQETLRTIEEYPFTIGYLSEASAEPAVRVLSFNGISPSASNIQGGAYPLTSPFGLVWRVELSELGARFLAFVGGPEGGKIIRAAGIVPVSVQR